MYDCEPFSVSKYSLVAFCIVASSMELDFGRKKRNKSVQCQTVLGVQSVLTRWMALRESADLGELLNPLSVFTDWNWSPRPSLICSYSDLVGLS